MVVFYFYLTPIFYSVELCKCGAGNNLSTSAKSSKITDLYSKIEVSDLTVNSIYIFLLGRGGVGVERNLSLRLRIHGNDNWLSSGSGCPPWHQWLRTSFSCARYTKDFVFVFHRCLGTGLTTENHDAFNRIFLLCLGSFLESRAFAFYISVRMPSVTMNAIGFGHDDQSPSSSRSNHAHAGSLIGYLEITWYANLLYRELLWLVRYVTRYVLDVTRYLKLT